MTTTEERPRITRPAASIAIDPARLIALRFRKPLRRMQLSDRITELGLTDDNGRPVRVGRDALGKYETGQRKPSLNALGAICAVLGCTPAELMPDGPEVTLPKVARERQVRLAHNDELRQFAIPRGLRYKNPKTGRVYYGKKLRAAYARYLAFQLAEAAGDEAAIREAMAAYDTALAAAPRAPGSAREDADGGELLAS